MNAKAKSENGDVWVAAVNLFRVSPGVADVLGFTHEQRVNDP